MSESDLPVLYSFRRCPYAMRARLAVRASGKTCELREIVLRDKAPEFLAASPKGTVPVLVLPDGTVIEESFEIMLWALGRSDPEGWLKPEFGAHQDMLDLVAACDNEFKRHLDAYKYASRDTPEAALIARAKGSEFLSMLDARLNEQNYLFGSRPALADMAVIPFVRQFANVDRSWFDAEPWPRLLAWLNTQLATPRFEAIMKKYPKWTAGDAPTLFG